MNEGNDIKLSDSLCYRNMVGKGMEDDFEVSIISDWEDGDAMNKNRIGRKKVSGKKMLPLTLEMLNPI